MKKKLIYLKMYKNKSLRDFISRHPVSLSKLIKRVKRMITLIQRKFPLFRHNDLHLKNIIVDDRNRLRLTDFELTRLGKRTPRIIPSFGITNRLNPDYDFHCFLNSLRSYLLRRKLSPVIVHKYLSPGYRGKTGKYVRNFRMLY
jgi:tRNA A-37 threonylcarbamoyl transferase component Bud32